MLYCLKSYTETVSKNVIEKSRRAAGICCSKSRWYTLYIIPVGFEFTSIRGTFYSFYRLYVRKKTPPKFLPSVPRLTHGKSSPRASRRTYTKYEYTTLRVTDDDGEKQIGIFERFATSRPNEICRRSAARPANIMRCTWRRGVSRRDVIL